ncbi:hypothetical protein ABGB17_14700 [Sphaerisporangium sp. B11E5]|uniref:hypothetical protein n=1 Tax=Sphaerisporangium sp. B11E5 TaxID=3153563 RepID=UPI00325F08AB
MKAWPFAIPGQVAFAGLVVYLLTRSAIDSLPPGAREAAYGGGAARAIVPFLVLTVLFWPVALLLRRGSDRAVTGGLLLMGVLTLPYLGMLAQTGLAGEHSLSRHGDLPVPEWYVPARAAAAGGAAVVYVVSLHLFARPTTLRPRPAPWPVPPILAHLSLIGLSVTGLGFVAVSQAGPIARERERADGEGHYAAWGFYLDQAAATARGYAVMFALVAVAAPALAAVTWRFGVSAPLLAGLGVLTPPFLVLMIAMSAATPFTLSGASGEPVPDVLSSGPEWYQPAVVTHSVLGATAYVAILALLLRGAPHTGARHGEP